MDTDAPATLAAHTNHSTRERIQPTGSQSWSGNPVCTKVMPLPDNITSKHPQLQTQPTAHPQLAHPINQLTSTHREIHKPHETSLKPRPQNKNPIARTTGSTRRSPPTIPKVRAPIHSACSRSPLNRLCNDPLQRTTSASLDAPDDTPQPLNTTISTRSPLAPGPTLAPIATQPRVPSHTLTPCSPCHDQSPADPNNHAPAPHPSSPHQPSTHSACHRSTENNTIHTHHPSSPAFSTLSNGSNPSHSPLPSHHLSSTPHLAPNVHQSAPCTTPMAPAAIELIADIHPNDIILQTATREEVRQFLRLQHLLHHHCGEPLQILDGTFVAIARHSGAWILRRVERAVLDASGEWGITLRTGEDVVLQQLCPHQLGGAQLQAAAQELAAHLTTQRPPQYTTLTEAARLATRLGTLFRFALSPPPDEPEEPSDVDYLEALLRLPQDQRDPAAMDDVLYNLSQTVQQAYGTDPNATQVYAATLASNRAKFTGYPTPSPACPPAASPHSQPSVTAQESCIAPSHQHPAPPHLYPPPTFPSTTFTEDRPPPSAAVLAQFCEAISRVQPQKPPEPDPLPLAPPPRNTAGPPVEEIIDLLPTTDPPPTIPPAPLGPSDSEDVAVCIRRQHSTSIPSNPPRLASRDDLDVPLAIRLRRSPSTKPPSQSRTTSTTPKPLASPFQSSQPAATELPAHSSISTGSQSTRPRPPNRPPPPSTHPSTSVDSLPTPPSPEYSHIAPLEPSHQPSPHPSPPDYASSEYKRRRITANRDNRSHPSTLRAIARFHRPISQHATAPPEPNPLPNPSHTSKPPLYPASSLPPQPTTHSHSPSSFHERPSIPPPAPTTSGLSHPTSHHTSHTSVQRKHFTILSSPPIPHTGPKPPTQPRAPHPDPNNRLPCFSEAAPPAPKLPKAAVAADA